VTVETEANGGLKEFKWKGSFHDWVLLAGTSEFCPALAALVGPVQNIFYSPYAITFRTAGNHTANPPLIFILLPWLEQLGYNDNDTKTKANESFYNGVFWSEANLFLTV
jgi:hypothetical protein